MVYCKHDYIPAPVLGMVFPKRQDEKRKFRVCRHCMRVEEEQRCDRRG